MEDKPDNKSKRIMIVVDNLANTLLHEHVMHALSDSEKFDVVPIGRFREEQENKKEFDFDKIPQYDDRDLIYPYYQPPTIKELRSWKTSSKKKTKNNKKHK